MNILLVAAVLTARVVGNDPHPELLKFVSPSGLIRDYLGELPTAEDCAACRPNAKGWWTPIENGPMFTGPWLEAVCARANRTGSAEDRALARQLANGLLAASRCSKTPGFIARGFGKDGAHYPVGSMDQTLPWFYGLYAYWKSGLAESSEADEIRAQILAVARAIEANGWKCPCEPPFDREACGDFINDGLPFRNAAHGLFLFRILAEFEPARMPFYDKLAHEASEGSSLTRLEVCAKGYETDIPRLRTLEPHLLWIYVTAQGCLRVLAELEPNEPSFRVGLRANAARAQKFLALAKRYDNSTERPFKYANWRTGYKWRPQKTIAESDSVSWTGKREILGTRKNLERDHMTAPLSAAAICAYAGEAHDEIDEAVSHYDWSTLNISEFFWAEVANEACLHPLSEVGESPLTWSPLYEPGCGGAIVSVEENPLDPNHVVSGGDMLGTAVSFDGGEKWTSGLGLPSYEMATPTFHPSRKLDVWIGSCMGPFLSHDGGRTWEWKRQGMPEAKRGRYTAIVEKILFDPQDSKRLLAFGGSSRGWTKNCDAQGAVWESLDEGENWHRLGTVTTAGFVTNAVKGADVVKAFWGPEKQPWAHLFAREAGWFTSTDGGRTWRKRKCSGLDTAMTAVTGHPKDPNVFWAVSAPGKPDADGKRTPGRIWKSVDRGKTFLPSDEGIKRIASARPHHVSHYNEIAVSPVDPDVLYVSDMSWSSGSVWLSEDGGRSWRKSTDKSMVTTACYAGPSVRISPSQTHRGTAYAYNSEYVLKTTDCGKSWTDMTAYRPDPTKPANWRGRGWNGWCSRGIVFNPYQKGESVLFGMDASRGWFSNDGLKSWSYARGDTGPWCGGTGAAFSKDGYVYIGTGQRHANNGIVVSRDHGRTWHSYFGSAHGLPERQSEEYGGVWTNPESGCEAFVLHGGKMYRTSDGGEHWQPDPSCTMTGDFAEDPTKTGRFYLKNDRGVFVTEDWKSFRPIGLVGHAEGKITVDAKGRVLVCRGRDGSNFGLFRYDPESGEWTKLHGHRLSHAIAVDPRDPTRIVLGTKDLPYHDFAGGEGVFISSDDGKTWTPANEGLHVRRLTSLAFDPHTPGLVVGATGGGGFVTAHWNADK